jgi:hypothetical protein
MGSEGFTPRSTVFQKLQFSSIMGNQFTSKQPTTIQQPVQQPLFTDSCPKRLHEHLANFQSHILLTAKQDFTAYSHFTKCTAFPGSPDRLEELQRARQVTCARAIVEIKVPRGALMKQRPLSFNPDENGAQVHHGFATTNRFSVQNLFISPAEKGKYRFFLDRYAPHVELDQGGKQHDLCTDAQFLSDYNWHETVLLPTATTKKQWDEDQDDGDGKSP